MLVSESGRQDGKLQQKIMRSNTIRTKVYCTLPSPHDVSFSLLQINSGVDGNVGVRAIRDLDGKPAAFQRCSSRKDMLSLEGAMKV